MEKLPGLHHDPAVFRRKSQNRQKLCDQGAVQWLYNRKGQSPAQRQIGAQTKVVAVQVEEFSCEA